MSIALWFIISKERLLYFTSSTILYNRAEVATFMDNLAINFELWNITWVWNLIFQNKRGGRIVLQDIGKPAQDEWGTPLQGIEAALELEKTVNQSILDIHAVASSRNDPQLCDFLETHFLTEQVEAIKELSDWVTKLKGVGPGLGEHIIDGEIMPK